MVFVYETMIKLLMFLINFISCNYGGSSPHADIVKQYLNSKPGTRYSNNIIADALADVPEIIRRYNYPVEIHHVVTEDGYILEMHRIPHGRDKNNQPGTGRPVVLFHHGMLSSSADIIISGPGNSLGYRLVEEGYDLWLGNARGNYYSRNHTSLDPDDRVTSDFWRFSWEEIGYYDLPTCIDYILEITGQSKLHYMGFSQGGTTFLAMASLRPEYNEKIISFHGLAPASFSENNVNPFTQAVAPNEKFIDIMAFHFGFAEFFGRLEFYTLLGIVACSDESFLQPLCLYVSGEQFKRLNTTMLPVYIGHVPAGISIRQICHFSQIFRYGGFRRFDRGLAGNLATYAQFDPPAFNLTRIMTPAYLYYSLNDLSVNYKDVLKLSESLGGPVVLHEITDPLFTHLDFIWGVDQVSLLHDKVIENLRSIDSMTSN